MGTNQISRVKIVKKPSLLETLKNLKPGIVTRFRERDFKLAVTKNAVTTLKAQGFEFKVSEKGLVSEYDVTRLK